MGAEVVQDIQIPPRSSLQAQNSLFKKNPKNTLFSGEAGQESGNSASVAAAEHCSAEAKGDKLQEELPIFRKKKILSASI